MYGNQAAASVAQVPSVKQNHMQQQWSRPPQQSHRGLYNPHGPRDPQPYRTHGQTFGQQAQQIAFLETLATQVHSKRGITQAEMDEKDGFLLSLQALCDQVHEADPTSIPKVTLMCFGSLKSGFATAGSDMDLVIVVEGEQTTKASFANTDQDLPRALEKALLNKGHGARLLTKTRVPIIKICQKPEVDLLRKLRLERDKWECPDNYNVDSGLGIGSSVVDETSIVQSQDAAGEEDNSSNQVPASPSREAIPIPHENTPPPPSATKVMIGNIPFDATRQDLLEIIGGMQFAAIDFPFDNNRNSGSAVVEFVTHDQARAAAKVLNGATMKGRSIRVKLSHQADSSRRGNFAFLCLFTAAY